MSSEAIHHHVVVDTGVEAAFDAFTTNLGAWWPLAYTFSLASFTDAGIEPRVGGVWYECNARGELLSWGEVRGYAPAERLVLASFRNDLVEGNGGNQILLEDPSGNLIELFEPRSRSV